MLTVQPGPRDRRLLSALLILGVVAVTFYIVQQLTGLFFYFGDILLTFFLAWLLAFIISPIVTRIVDLIPRLPRAVATILVYTAVVADPGRPRRPRRRGPGELDRRLRDAAPGHQVEPARDPRAVAGLAELAGSRPGRPRGPGPGGPRQPRPGRRRARRAAPADRGGEPERGRHDADRLLPVDLHGPRPRRGPGVPVPDRAAELLGGGAPARDVGLALVRRVPARPGADGLRLLPHRLRDQRRARTAARRPDLGGGRPAPDDPVLRPVRVLGAAGHRRARPPARVRRAGADPHGRWAGSWS